MFVHFAETGGPGAGCKDAEWVRTGLGEKEREPSSVNVQTEAATLVFDNFMRGLFPGTSRYGVC